MTENNKLLLTALTLGGLSAALYGAYKTQNKIIKNTSIPTSPPLTIE
jgi:hypothetical protein